MVMVSMSGLMAENMLEVGRITKWMVTVSSLGQMEGNISDRLDPLSHY